MSSDTIGLKITKYSSFTAVAKIIKKYQEYSLFDLKNKIDNNQYVLLYDYIDDIGLKKIIKCYKELTKAKIETELYELDDSKTDIAFFESLSHTYDEISDEIDAEDEE